MNFSCVTLYCNGVNFFFNSFLSTLISGFRGGRNWRKRIGCRLIDADEDDGMFRNKLFDGDCLTPLSTKRFVLVEGCGRFVGITTFADIALMRSLNECKEEDFKWISLKDSNIR